MTTSSSLFYTAKKAHGKVAGTEALCTGIHPVLVKLAAIYTEFEFRVLTDDIVPIVPPPPSGSYADWQLLYVRYARFLSDLKEFSFSLAGLRHLVIANRSASAYSRCHCLVPTKL